MGSPFVAPSVVALVAGGLLGSLISAMPPKQMPAETVLGPKAFRDGDVVELTDVRSTSPKLEQGDTVTVRGRVRLASEDHARLCLYLTQTEGDGREETDPSQEGQVKKGLEEFERKTTIKHRGFLHLTLYDGKGRPFGGVYFGTAEQMKRMKEGAVDHYLSDELQRSIARD